MEHKRSSRSQKMVCGSWWVQINDDQVVEEEDEAAAADDHDHDDDHKVSRNGWNQLNL